MSQHPTDQLIRGLIATRRAATTAEIAAIIARMARAPFSERLASVPLPLRYATYQGRPLGARETSLIIHVVQRAVHEGQWSPDTDGAGYVASR